MKTWNRGGVAHMVPALLLAPLGFSPPGAAQISVEVRDVQMTHWEGSMRKVIALANAMPAETYTWSPGEGVMEVGHVFMHLAHYNYLYASQNLGMILPEGVALDEMESVRDKAQVVGALERSTEWLREQVGSMTTEALEARTQLYGQTVPAWAVLVQLETHLSEHLGQSIAYARMNGVVPPWSR